MSFHQKNTTDSEYQSKISTPHELRPQLSEGIHKILCEWYNPSYWHQCRLPCGSKSMQHSNRLFPYIRSSGHHRTSETQRWDFSIMKNIATFIVVSQQNWSCMDLLQHTTRNTNQNSHIHITPSETPYTHKNRKLYSNRFHTQQHP